MKIAIFGATGIIDSQNFVAERLREIMGNFAIKVHSISVFTTELPVLFLNYVKQHGNSFCLLFIYTHARILRNFHPLFSGGIVEHRQRLLHAESHDSTGKVRRGELKSYDGERLENEQHVWLHGIYPIVKAETA